MTMMTMTPCLACGERCGVVRFFSGVIGPFCSVRCRDKQEDRKVWERANAYAERLQTSVGELRNGGELQLSDVSRAFVIGFAAGLEHASEGRRVRR